MKIFKNKQNKEEVVVESTKDLEAPVVTEEEIKEEKKPTRTTIRKKNTAKTVSSVQLLSILGLDNLFGSLIT